MNNTPISPTEGEALLPTPVVYYFGCSATQIGHYLWDTEWNKIYGHPLPRNLERGIDGTFVPAGAGWQSSRVGPWWIISCIDNTVDTRPGSHSTFVGKGFIDEETFEAAARARFPSVFSRLEGLTA